MNDIRQVTWNHPIGDSNLEYLQGHFPFPIKRLTSSSTAVTAPATLRHISKLAMPLAVQAIVTARKPLPFPIFHTLVPSSIGAAHQHVSTKTQ